MSDKPFDRSRRNLLRAGIATAAALPLGGLVLDGRARAADMPKLSEDDPQAQALSYVHDATKSQSSARQKDAFCHNCMHFKGGANDQWGPCNIFPGKLVNRDGWCSAWAKASG